MSARRPATVYHPEMVHPAVREDDKRVLRGKHRQQIRQEVAKVAIYPMLSLLESSDPETRKQTQVLRGIIEKWSGL